MMANAGATYADFGANPVVSAPLALPAPHTLTPRNDSGTTALTLATATHQQRELMSRAAGHTVGGCFNVVSFHVMLCVMCPLFIC